MFGLFKRKNRAEQGDETVLPKPSEPAPPPVRQEPVRYARGTRIRYDEGLVDKLMDDHQRLLKIYTEITDAAENRNFEVLAERLNRFRIELTDHLLTENVKLYVFLDRSVEDDEMNSELIRSFRREMDQIGKVVMEFLRRYLLHGVSSLNVADFQAEFIKIGEVLGDRITREESTLYIMYQQV